VLTSFPVALPILFVRLETLELNEEAAEDEDDDDDEEEGEKEEEDPGYVLDSGGL
jgi:hypothetical protein